MESRTNVGERRSAEAGFSLLEALVSATILMTMVFVVSTLSMSGTNAQKYSERVGRVTEISQDLVDEIRGHLQSSVRLFHDDAIGAAYRNLLALPAAPVPLNSSLPRLEAAAIFERDPAVGGKTGNQLLFAKHAWTTEFECASSNRHRIDVYRVVCYYLAIEDAGPQPNSAVGLNLCRFVSEPLADGKQIDRIPDPADQIEVLEHLRDGTPGADGRTFPPVAVVWRLGDAPATVGTLRQIDGLGALVTSPIAPRGPGWELLPDVRQSSNGLLSYRMHSIATNFAPAAMRVGQFGVVSNTANGGAGFPHGFEVQLIGPASARQVLLLFSVVSTNRGGTAAHAMIQAISDARDI